MWLYARPHQARALQHAALRGHGFTQLPLYRALMLRREASANEAAIEALDRTINEIP